MIRIMASLIMLFTKQEIRESSEFFWKHYDRTKNSSGIKQRISGSICHKLFRETGSGIPVETTFAEYPTLPHGLFGIFISSGARLGSGCTIFQQVTIGSNTIKDSKGFGAPTIGNNVFIGAGAKIIGNVTIGSNVRIGAGCVVTENVPDNATVVMNSPRIIVGKDVKENGYVEYGQNI